MPWIPFSWPSFSHQWLSKWIACVILVYLIPIVLLGLLTTLPQRAPLSRWLHPFLFPFFHPYLVSSVHGCTSDSDSRIVAWCCCHQLKPRSLISSSAPHFLSMWICLALCTACCFRAIQFALHATNCGSQPHYMILVAMVDCNQWRNSDMQ